jgi:outer membrane protein assembly factor BamB
MRASRIITVATVLLAASAVFAEDWPTYRHDNRRTGATGQKLAAPLKQIWRYDSPSAPVPAWAKPAKWNAFAGVKGLSHMRQFDSAFHVTVSGDRVFFGSSADDAAHCLDAATGKSIWTAHTDGPVRLPPTIADGKAYFGSDDGQAYCVKASDGSRVWKYRAAPEERFVPSNGKLISLWPVRTGVLVDNGKAYFGASLLPWRDSRICGVDAATGSDSGPGLFATIDASRTMQGAMLASDKNLFVLQGRSGAIVFARETGKLAHALAGRGDGGAHAALTADEQLIYGPGSRTGVLSVFDNKTRKRIKSISGANRIVVGPQMCYVYKPGKLSSMPLAQQAKTDVRIAVLRDKQKKLAAKLKGLSKAPKGKKETDEQATKRKAEIEKIKSEQKEIPKQLTELGKSANKGNGWSVDCPEAYEIILAGDTLLLGGDGEVTARAAGDGKLLWTGKVDGKARGLAAANGRLYVSTDKGKIHCFTTEDGAKR